MVSTSANFPNVIGELSGGGPSPRSSKVPSLITAVSSSSALSASALDRISRLVHFDRLTRLPRKLPTMHACSDRERVPCACRSCANPSFVPPSSGSLSDATEHSAAMPGMMLFLGASRVSLQPGACLRRARGAAPCARTPCRWCPGSSRRTPRPPQRSTKVSSRNPPDALPRHTTAENRLKSWRARARWRGASAPGTVARDAGPWANGLKADHDGRLQ